MDPNVQGNTIAGTIGGTLMVLLFRLTNSEVLHSVILAAIGATAAFAVSLFWKQVWALLTKKYRNLKSKQHHSSQKEKFNGKV